MKQTPVLLILACLCLTSRTIQAEDKTSQTEDKVENLIITEAWQPDHAQTGKTVKVTVRISSAYRKHISNPYQEPLTKELFYGNKGHVLNAKKKPTGLLIYIKSSAPLPEEEIQTLTGKLDVSIYQVKGGSYPATLWLRKPDATKAPGKPSVRKPADNDSKR